MGILGGSDSIEAGRDKTRRCSRHDPGASRAPPPLAGSANRLAGAWDQNAGIVVLSPIAAKLEEVAMR
jgi:hypothetical protein